MLKIYGIDVSTWSNRVRFTANYLGLEYEYIQINLMMGEGQSETYRSLHPAGKVPAIDDDGFHLFESGAITRYLAKKENSDLYPQDLKQSALVDQWSDFVTQHIAKAFERVVFNRALFKLVGAEQDQRSLDEGLKFLDRFLPIVDEQLGRSKHLASNQISLADMTLLCWMDPAEVCSINLDQYANLNTWRNRLKQADFYTACHNDYREVFNRLSQ